MKASQLVYRKHIEKKFNESNFKAIDNKQQINCR